MNTVAWIALVLGGLIVRQGAVGRATETPQDLRDLFFAVITGQWDDAKTVIDRKGGTTQESVADTGERIGESVGSAVGSAIASTEKGALLLAKMRQLGGAAKGYRLGSTGPTYYDCSGLVWRAMKDLGFYKGGRFTTFTWPGVGKKICTQTTTPGIGDIVVWQRGALVNGHMGVVSGSNTFYAAQSTKTGIKEAKISGISGKISYWRLN